MKQDVQPAANEKLSQALLLLSLMSVGIGQSFIFASLPPIGREIGLADVRISSLITAGAAAFVVAAFLWGGIINRIGRVRSVIIGMLCYGVTIALTGGVLQQALADDLSSASAYYWIFSLRIVFALGVAGIMPSVQTYLVAHSDIKHRSGTIAKIGASFSVGMILGPALASLLSSFGLTAPFYIIAAFVFFVGALVVLFVKDQKHVRQHVKPKPINWLKQPAMPFLLMSVLAILSVTGIQQVIGFVIQDRFLLDAAHTTRLLGFAMMSMSCFSILMQMVLVPKFQFSAQVLILNGLVFALLAQLTFIFSHSYLGVLVAMGLFGVGLGSIFPGVLTAQTLLVKDDQQSRLASINASMQGIGATLGPVTLASLYQVSMDMPFYGLLIGIAVMAGIFLRCRERLLMAQA
ncbi:MFS transporter [Marinomonas epiphytica]